MTVRLRFLAALALMVLAGDAIIAYRNVNGLIAAEQPLTSSHARLNALESSVSTVKDAETGQRGYLLTGDEAYLVVCGSTRPARGSPQRSAATTIAWRR